MMIRMTIIRTMMMSEPQCRKIFCRSNDYKDVKLIVNNYISFVEVSMKVFCNWLSQSSTQKLANFSNSKDA